MAVMTLEWTPAIAVGVATIDTQHQELFTQVNALMAGLSAGKGKEEVTKALAFLQDYVLNHFAMEEKYMTQFAYPGVEAHKTQHQKFVEDFLALKKVYEAEGATIRVAMEVQKRVGDWLITHIKRTDKELGEFLKGKV